MEFVNLSPFAAQDFSSIGTDGHEYRVVVFKVGYRLIPASTGRGRFVAEPMQDDSPAIRSRDIYWGEEGASSLIEESDFTAFKPRCDVLLCGHAWAPGGKAKRRWGTRLRVTSGRELEPIPDPKPPQPLNQFMKLTPRQLDEWEKAKLRVRRQRETAAQTAGQREVLLDKTIQATGPSWFKRDIFRLWLSWRKTWPQKAQKVALRWEHAFGGSSVLPNPAHATDPDKPEYLVNSDCYSNPVGCGWIDERHFFNARKAGSERPWTLPAPQLHYPFEPIWQLRCERGPSKAISAQEQAQIADRCPTPAGYGPVGRSWAPRLALVGTCDKKWEQERCPQFPEDFDFRYYNCAPQDQQMDHPNPDKDIQVELWNLTNPRLTPGGYMRFKLPDHKPYLVVVPANGPAQPIQMLTDTLRIDTDAMELTLTHRIRVQANVAINQLVAFLETDPAGPIAQWQQARAAESQNPLNPEAA